MPRFHNVNGEKVQFSVEEETARDAEEKAWADNKTVRDWAKIRNERNARLSITDWWASSDLTMSDARKKYRSDLRDLPSTISDPSETVIWPNKPD